MATERYILKHKKTITQGILDFLESDRHYEYEVFVKTRELTLKDVREAAEFARKYMGKDIYKNFMEKALPFEQYEGCDHNEEKEPLKERVSKLAVDIRWGRANLIDILDNGFSNFYQYLAMVRQLAYKYKVISATAYLENSEYLKLVSDYSKDNVTSSASYLLEDEVAISKIIESRGLKPNAITKSAAYHYAKRQVEKNKQR